MLRRLSVALRGAFAVLAVLLVTTGLLGMHVVVDHGHAGSQATASESCHHADCPPSETPHATDCVPAPAAPAPALPAVVVLSRSDAQPVQGARTLSTCPARAPAPSLVALSISRT